MAESQNKSGKSDQQKLAELEKQLATKASESKQGKAAAAETKPASRGKSPTVPENKPLSAKASTAPARGISAAKPDSGKKAKTGFLWFVTIINFVVLLVIVAGAYWAWLQWQDQGRQRQVEAQQQRSFFSEQQQKLALSAQAERMSKGDLQRQDQALQSSINSLVEQVQITAAQTESNKLRLADVSGRRPSDWLLAEADYLVRMAGRKLWLEQDEKTAILMLQSADTRLQDMDDPSLLPIRQQLANDIQSLQQINPVSLSSIALAVGALVPQVDNLPLAMFKRPEIVEEALVVTDSVSDWRTNLKKNWQEVTKDFFSVKRKQAQINPFMDEQQQWLSREQLKLSLQQAKASILIENNSLFRQSLQASLAQLIENYDLQKPAIEQFAASLQNLLDTDVERIYPGQIQSAVMLQDLVDRRMQSRFSNGEPSL